MLQSTINFHIPLPTNYAFSTFHFKFEFTDIIVCFLLTDRDFPYYVWKKYTGKNLTPLAYVCSSNELIISWEGKEEEPSE